jgi:hypothetical protein
VLVTGSIGFSSRCYEGLGFFFVNRMMGARRVKDCSGYPF